MGKRRKVDAQNLNDVLSDLLVQQQTGLLQVESTQGGRLEEGELYVLAGSPMYARAGKLGGQEALNRLLSWYTIRFSFITDAPRPPANLPSLSKVASSPAPIVPDNVVSFSRETAFGRESFIPQKTGPGQQGLSLPLVYRQRMIYFLVDGHRSIADLSRYSGKTVQEIEEILQELQRWGLITISAPR